MVFSSICDGRPLVHTKPTKLRVVKCLASGRLTCVGRSDGKDRIGLRSNDRRETGDESTSGIRQRVEKVVLLWKNSQDHGISYSNYLTIYFQIELRLVRHLVHLRSNIAPKQSFWSNAELTSVWRRQAYFRHSNGESSLQISKSPQNEFIYDVSAPARPAVRGTLFRGKF